MAAKHEREILKKKAEVRVNILKYCLFTSTTQDAEAVARRIRAKREAEKEKQLLEEEKRQEKLRQKV